jgi:hypothetical protein
VKTYTIAPIKVLIQAVLFQAFATQTAAVAWKFWLTHSAKLASTFSFIMPFIYSVILGMTIHFYIPNDCRDLLLTAPESQPVGQC